MQISPRSLRALLVVALAVVSGACASAKASRTSEQPPSAVPTPGSSASASGPRPVVVDLDLDSSDIAALAILLRDPAIDVRAILVDGTGLVHCAPGLRNVSYLLGQLGASDIPVACGREDAGPDGRPFPADWRVGPDTAWGIDIPPQIGTGIPDDAATLLGRVLDTSKEPVTIVALGPWTNLEDTFAADPALAARVAGIHAMAGRSRCPGKRHRRGRHRRRPARVERRRRPVRGRRGHGHDHPDHDRPARRDRRRARPARPRRPARARSRRGRRRPHLRAPRPLARPDDRPGPAALGRARRPCGQPAGSRHVAGRDADDRPRRPARPLAGGTARPGRHGRRSDRDRRRPPCWRCDGVRRGPTPSRSPGPSRRSSMARPAR